MNYYYCRRRDRRDKDDAYMHTHIHRLGMYSSRSLDAIVMTLIRFFIGRKLFLCRRDG